MLLNRGQIDVPALFDPNGRYRYLNGVNVSAVAAVGVGVGVYYALPQASIKVLWGIGVSAVAYLVFRRLEAVVKRLHAPAGVTAASNRSSSSG